MAAPNPSILTPREYLELDRKAESRSEYIAGRIYAMSGASRRHGLIAFNIANQLGPQIDERPCEAFVSEMRVKVSPTGMYTYPVVVAVCGEPRFEDAQTDTLLNPTVIFEVLSPSTEAYDRGEKFAHYRRLESLHDYVLVAQDKIRIEHFRREGEEWTLSEASGPEGVLHLASIDCHLDLAAIYRKVDFESPEV